MSLLGVKAAIHPELLWSVARYREFGFKLDWRKGYAVLLVWFLLLTFGIAQF